MKYVIALLVFFSLPALVVAQTASQEQEEASPTQSYTLNRTTSVFVVEGTSTLHDWEMISKECKGSITYTLDGDQVHLYIFGC